MSTITSQATPRTFDAIRLALEHLGALVGDVELSQQLEQEQNEAMQILQREADVLRDLVAQALALVKGQCSNPKCKCAWQTYTRNASKALAVWTAGALETMT